MRVLVVEDNLDIQANIADFLETEYTLDFASDGDQGLALAMAHEYDVIVLDLMLPKRDGLEVCRCYRKKNGIQAPVLMLTARDTLDDKEIGFSVGADDYLVKPFSLRELKMRIEALSRRPKIRYDVELTVGPLQFHRETLTLCANAHTTSIHEKEGKILSLLIESSPQFVSSESIVYALWRDEPPESSALRSHIYTLRKALTTIGLEGSLQTKRGKGYALVLESV